VRVLFAGTPAVAVPSLDALVQAGFDVVAVLTRPDAPVGRKRVLTPSPVAARAAELGIEVIHAARVDAEATARIAAVNPDIAAIVAYGGLVPPGALAIPRHGWINLHFSLLPAWRGAAPVQRAVMAGDDVTGAVTFLLEEGLDTGPVFGTLTESVGPEDTAGELLERLSHSGAVLLAQTLSAIESGKAPHSPRQVRFPSRPSWPLRMAALIGAVPPLPSGGRPAASLRNQVHGRSWTGSGSNWNRSG
jgi:methionyl-tRNA formyltransferase